MKIFSRSEEGLFLPEPELREVAAYCMIMEKVAEDILKQRVDPEDFANIKSLVAMTPQRIKDENLYEDIKASVRCNECLASDLRLLKISLHIAFGANSSADLGHAFTVKELAQQRFDDDEKSDLTLAIANGQLMAAFQSFPLMPQSEPQPRSDYRKIADATGPKKTSLEGLDL